VTDRMEAVQQLTLDRIEDSLARHHDRPGLAGRSECETLECGEPISRPRQDLGARFCLGCQTEIERKQSNGWRR